MKRRLTLSQKETQKYSDHKFVETSAKSDDKEKTNILQKQLVSMFTKKLHDKVSVHDNKTDVNIFNINFTGQMVEKVY